MKELTIVANVLSAAPGEILERAREYQIEKETDGFIHGVFKNANMEESAIKLTLTGLRPNTAFCFMNTMTLHPVCHKKANTAGILEVKVILPPNTTLTLKETITQ